MGRSRHVTVKWLLCACDVGSMSCDSPAPASVPKQGGCTSPTLPRRDAVTLQRASATWRLPRALGLHDRVEIPWPDAFGEGWPKGVRT